jgi:superfamily II DNA/RNA helicase
MQKQQTELRACPDIVVGTPGRVIDHLRNSLSFSLEHVEILVLDEVRVRVTGNDTSRRTLIWAG